MKSNRGKRDWKRTLGCRKADSADDRGLPSERADRTADIQEAIRKAADRTFKAPPTIRVDFSPPGWNISGNQTSGTALSGNEIVLLPGAYIPYGNTYYIESSYNVTGHSDHIHISDGGSQIINSSRPPYNWDQWGTVDESYPPEWEDLNDREQREAFCARAYELKLSVLDYQFLDSVSSLKEAVETFKDAVEILSRNPVFTKPLFWVGNTASVPLAQNSRAISVGDPISFDQWGKAFRTTNGTVMGYALCPGKAGDIINVRIT